MAIQYHHALDRLFHALGDQTRRSMLSSLSQTDRLSANDLAKPFAISQPTASKHIKVLETACLITRQVEGRVHYFRLNVDGLEQAEAWINRHKQFWAASLHRLERLVEKKNHEP